MINAEVESQPDRKTGISERARIVIGFMFLTIAVGCLVGLTITTGLFAKIMLAFWVVLATAVFTGLSRGNDYRE